MPLHGSEQPPALFSFQLRLIGKFSADADALANTLGQQSLAFRIDELVLQRRASCVDYENFHLFNLQNIDKRFRPVNNRYMLLPNRCLPQKSVNTHNGN